MVAVGALVDRPLTSLIWLRKSGIKGVGDLRGKTVATAGIPYQDAYLQTILSRAKVPPNDVKTVNVGFGLLPAILSGRADAMLGGFSNVEGVDLQMRGKDPVITPVDQLGVPTYDELVLVANRSKLEEDDSRVRLFLAALARGTAAAVKSPAATTKALLEANDALDPKLTEAEVKATLPVLSRDGSMNSEEWSTFLGWMQANGLISAAPPVSKVMTTPTCRAASPNRRRVPGREAPRCARPRAAARRSGLGRNRSRGAGARETWASFSTPSAITSSERARAMPIDRLDDRGPLLLDPERVDEGAVDLQRVEAGSG